MYGDSVKNSIICVVLAAIMVCVSLFGYPVNAQDTPEELKELYAQSAVLMDADSGRILFGKHEFDVLPMASTTKIMTCIIALENLEQNQIGEVSLNAAKQPKVHLGVKKGETYYIKDLLYSLMLESHNDSAVIIAEAIGGSVERFAAMMNAKAREIGCSNTYFITPNGLDDEDDKGIHATTAADLARMMRYCILESPEKDVFLKITGEKEYQFTDVTGSRTFVCYNHNLFLDMMNGAISGKTGFTNDAGYCYVGAIKRGKRTFIVALLACGWPGNKGYKWIDTRKMMEYALENYEYKTIFMPTVCDDINVKNGIDEKNPLKFQEYVKVKISAKESKLSVLMSKDERIETKILRSSYIEAPVEKGEKVGTIYYCLNDRILMSTDIVTEEAVGKRNIKPVWREIINRYFYKTKKDDCRING